MPTSFDEYEKAQAGIKSGSVKVPVKKSDDCESCVNPLDKLNDFNHVHSGVKGSNFEQKSDPGVGEQENPKAEFKGTKQTNELQEKVLKAMAAEIDRKEEKIEYLMGLIGDPKSIIHLECRNQNEGHKKAQEKSEGVAQVCPSIPQAPEPACEVDPACETPDSSKTKEDVGCEESPGWFNKRYRGSDFNWLAFLLSSLLALFLLLWGLGLLPVVSKAAEVSASKVTTKLDEIQKSIWDLKDKPPIKVLPIEPFTKKIKSLESELKAMKIQKSRLMRDLARAKKKKGQAQGALASQRLHIQRHFELREMAIRELFNAPWKPGEGKRELCFQDGVGEQSCYVSESPEQMKLNRIR